MRIIIGMLLVGMMLVLGCVQETPRQICEDMCGDGICQEIVCQGTGCPCAETPENCPQDCKEKNVSDNFCDAVTPCETGECYKFEDKEGPICFEGDPCSRCPSGECVLLESYPPQVRCIEGELVGEPPCDENNECDIGECYKYDDRDYPICWEGEPCSRCTSGNCNLIGTDPPVVDCLIEEPPGDEFCGWSTAAVCSNDSDCMTGGCSGQVCQSKNEEPVATTCEYMECYDAESYGLSCGCMHGRCGWKKNCTAYDISECPVGCQVCPPCPECSSLVCLDEEICEGLGFDENWSANVTQ